ncbi:MAG: ribose-5-phosphate isomerase RpiA [Myxococcota bacterium]
MTDASKDAQKAAAAKAAVAHIVTNTTIGLGTGSTMAFALDALAERIRAEGLVIQGVPTSQATADRAQQLGIPLTTLDASPELDLAIDGADEVDPNFAMIKGGGGALLREKIVAHAAKHVIIVVDAGKRVERLGAFPLPIEVVPFGAATVKHHLEQRGMTTQLRQRDGATWVTDEGNWILDAKAPTPIVDPAGLHAKLVAHPAVVETGLFVGLLDTLIVGGPAGVETLLAG